MLVSVRFLRNGFVSEIDNEGPTDVGSNAIDESGGRPSEEELSDVAKTIEKLAEFWCFFSDMGISGETIANFLPIGDTQTPARIILIKWDKSTRKTEAEKREFLHRVAEYHHAISPEGMFHHQS